MTEPSQTKQSERRSQPGQRRRWAVLWSAIWGGVILIVLGYFLFRLLENKTIEQISREATWRPFVTQFGATFIILLGILVIGHGLIQWYFKE